MRALLAPILFIAAVAAMPPAAHADYLITPFLTCVEPGPTANTNTAYFGYESFEPSIVQILLSSDNRFLPNPANRNQPTLFFPGYHPKAFRVSVQPGIVTQWLFDGKIAAVGFDAPSCDAAAELPSLPAGVVSLPYSQQLTALGGLAGRSWFGFNLPPGLTLSTDGLLSGTPLTPGTFPLTVNANDGTTTASANYRLVIHSGLTISNALSTRPPGFVPQFRTVTQVGGSNSAVATCDTREFVVTGGGSCVVPNQNTVQGRIASSQATSNGWSVTCSGGTATAMAVCAPKP